MLLSLLLLSVLLLLVFPTLSLLLSLLTLLLLDELELWLLVLLLDELLLNPSHVAFSYGSPGAGTTAAVPPHANRVLLLLFVYRFDCPL
jgi:hypothetical protein